MHEEIYKDPYNFIKNYYEQVYKFMGGEVFSTLALVIPSLIIPAIPHKNAREIKPSINFLLIAPPGCIDGNSYITNSDGTFTKIKDFGLEHLQKINKFVMINPSKPDCKYQSKAEKFHRYENQQCFKITLNSGREIIVSELHPLLRKKDWVKAKDLKVGDELRVMHEIKCFKNSYEEFPKNKTAKQSKKINVPSCNEDVGFLLGYGVGDGSCRKYKTQFCVNDEEKDLIVELMDDIICNFDVTPKVYERDLSKYKGKIENREIKRKQIINYVEVDSIQFSNIFQCIRTKRVPEIIMSSKKSVVANFLKGLFEADGCCRKKERRGLKYIEICLKSRSKELLQDVLLLLLKFGIKARIDKDNLSIAKYEDVFKFKKEIGFASCKKKTKLDYITENLDVSKKRRYKNNYTEKIKSIEKIKPQVVYDIEVPKAKRYIANGIISHNTAKSSMCETFEKLAYNSFPFESITDSKLYSELSKRDFVSLVVGDVHKIFSNTALTKTMENVLGDEQKLSRFTQRTDAHEKKIRAVAFLAGTPNSLTSVIQDGIIFRTSVCLIFHDPEEHEEIGKFVTDGVFERKAGMEIEESIQKYYYELLQIQTNEHPDFKPIRGYVVDPEFKKMIFNAWRPLVKPVTERTKFSFFRELHQAFRYMVAHAFLNIFNREIRDREYLVIDKKDVEVAIDLMRKELKTKFEILSSNKVVSEEKLKTTKDLADFVRKCKNQKVDVSEKAVNIMGSLLRATS
jgi:intein/homing endonuclease